MPTFTYFHQIRFTHTHTHTHTHTLTHSHTLTHTHTHTHTLTLTPTQVVSYTKQIVAGTNYIISLKHAAGTSEVKVFKPLPHTGRAAQVVSITLTQAAAPALGRRLMGGHSASRP